MYSGRIIFKVLAKLKQFNLAILPASNHRNIPYIPNSLYSLFGKTYPFDILLTEKRSACLVAGAPFVVPVIHFCFDFRSRHILSALSRSPRGWAKTEKNSLMHTQSPINPTRSTKQWTAAAHRPEHPRWLPPGPGLSHRGRSRTAPLRHPWPSPGKQESGAGTPVHRGS